MLAVTTDMQVEGVDFLPDEDPQRLGRRALAVNLSDLAAMGAEPAFFLLSIGFPPEKGEDYPLAVARGALSRAGLLAVALVGATFPLSADDRIDCSLGRTEPRTALRSGGSPGDSLFLSGFPGRAAAGLHLRAAARKARDRRASRRNTPGSCCARLPGPRAAPPRSAS